MFRIDILIFLQKSLKVELDPKGAMQSTGKWPPTPEFKLYTPKKMEVK